MCNCKQVYVVNLQVHTNRESLGAAIAFVVRCRTKDIGWENTLINTSPLPSSSRFDQDVLDVGSQHSSVSWSCTTSSESTNPATRRIVAREKHGLQAAACTVDTVPFALKGPQRRTFSELDVYVLVYMLLVKSK